MKPLIREAHRAPEGDLSERPGREDNQPPWITTHDELARYEIVVDAVRGILADKRLWNNAIIRGRLHNAMVEANICNTSRHGDYCYTHGCGPYDPERCLKPDCPHCRGE